MMELNGTTNFTIGAQTVTLNATDNITKTVADKWYITRCNRQSICSCIKSTGADYAFISTMIIQSYASTYTAIAPANLAHYNYYTQFNWFAVARQG